MTKEKKSKRDRSPSYDNERYDKRDSNRNIYADSSRNRINDDKWIRNRDRSRDRSKSRERYDDRSGRSNYHKEEKRSRHSRSRSRSKERHRSDKESDRKSSSTSSRHSSSTDIPSSKSLFSTKESIIKQPQQQPLPPAIVLSAQDKEKLRETERAAEQEALEEEMRKRRERVKAWQDAKAAAAAKSQPESSTSISSSVTLNASKSNENDHDKSKSNESKHSVANDNNIMNGGEEVEEEGEEEEPKWTLEDENEEENIAVDVDSTHNTHDTKGEDSDDYLSYPLIGDPDSSSSAGIAEHKHIDEADDEEEETAVVFSSAASKLKKASITNVKVNISSSSSSTPVKPSLKIETTITAKSVNIAAPPVLTIPSLQVSIPQYPQQLQLPSKIITQQTSVKTATTVPPVVKQEEEDPLDAFMKSLYTTSADLDKEDGGSTTATPTATTGALSGPATTATLSQKSANVPSSSSSSSTSSSNSGANNTTSSAYRIDPFGSNFITMEDLIKMGNNDNNENEYDDMSSSNNEESEDYEYENNNDGIDKRSGEIMIQANSMNEQQQHQKSKKKKAKTDSSNNKKKKINEEVIFRAGWESDLPSSPDHNTSDHDNERRTIHKTTTTTTNATNINNTADSSSSSSSIIPSSSMLSAASMAAAQAQKLIDEEEEREEAERRMFIQALRQASASSTSTLGVTALAKSNLLAAAASNNTGASTSSSLLTAIDTTANTSSSSSASSAAPERSTSMGRIFAGEGDMIEESEVEDKKKSALELLDEAKKGKELKPVDHSTIDYIALRKNLYIVPKALARLSEQQIKEKREDLQTKVRGRQCPAPVDTWEQCGLSERTLQVIKKQNLEAPFAIQKQAIPAIMCGRDVIAIAKTGSGKTLAFLLPLFRHIQDQPPLQPHLPNEGGPIGLILAPARELALQIAREAKRFGGAIGLSVACIYGGAGVADQIGELKRGADIVVCTPGRMIDILCMQAGKLVSLRRVSFVVMDEADRILLSRISSK